MCMYYVFDVINTHAFIEKSGTLPSLGVFVLYLHPVCTGSLSNSTAPVSYIGIRYTLIH